jgi:hypothetical protein
VYTKSEFSLQELASKGQQDLLGNISSGNASILTLRDKLATQKAARHSLTVIEI